MTEITIGVDVSKEVLDIHLHPAGEDRRFSNDTKGFRAMLKWLAGRPVARLVFEATGPYHRAFETAMGKAGLLCVRSIRVRPDALAKLWDCWPKPTGLMRACWPGSVH